MPGLENKVALITAATSSNGLAYARHLLQKGVKVAMCDIDFKSCELFALKLAMEFGVKNVLAMECDAIGQQQFERAFKICMFRFRRLDIVVNNTVCTRLEFDQGNENQAELIDAMMREHYGGVVAGTLLAIKYMGAPRGGQGGTLVQITCSRSTSSAIVEYMKAIGDVRSSNYLNIRTMALFPNNIPDNAGRALIHILEQGSSGQYWVVHNDVTPILATTAGI